MARKRKRPEESFKALKGARPPYTDRTKGGYDKRATTLTVMSAEEKEPETGGLLSPSLFVPNEEQLEKINRFTLRSVPADEVACFTTHSCNDIIDRDDDQFTTKTVKEFASLAPPFSPTGKSFMVSHDTSKLAVGRIFDTGTGTFDYPGDSQKHTKLTNDVYIPRTVASNKDFIENMEMGINWAVSVGVMIGGATCEVGKSHDWGWVPWWCSAGHEKGLAYDPESEEEDDWGWPVPISETAKGAVRCYRAFNTAKDMYELSMVFLGAQYMAGLADKDPEFSGILKSASSVHILGLRSTESKEIRFPELPVSAREASKRHKITEEEGSFRWSDDNNMVWSFMPGSDSEPMLLGVSSGDGLTSPELNAKAQDFKSKLVEAKGILENKDVAGAAALASQLDGLLNEIDEALDQGDVDSANPLMDQAQGVMDQLFDALYDQGDDSENEDQDPEDKSVDADKSHSHYHEHSDGTGHSHNHSHAGGSYDHGADDLEVSHTHSHDNKSPQGGMLSKRAILAALEKRSLPESLKNKISGLKDDSPAALDILLDTVSEEFKSVSDKAAAGEAYVKDLHKEVLDWYRKAKQDPRSTKGVEVSHIERLLDRAGNDTEILVALRDDYKAEAEARFGKSVRRSSVEADPNSPNGSAAEENIGDLESRIDGGRVKRIHG